MVAVFTWMPANLPVTLSLASTSTISRSGNGRNRSRRGLSASRRRLKSPRGTLTFSKAVDKRRLSRSRGRPDRPAKPEAASDSHYCRLSVRTKDWWKSTAVAGRHFAWLALRRWLGSVPSTREFPAESKAKTRDDRAKQQADSIHNQEHWHKNQWKELVHSGTVDQFGCRLVGIEPSAFRSTELLSITTPY